VKQRRLLGLDFETYYCSKSGYTLRKMDPPSYMLDPRFEMTLCSVKIDNNPAFIVDGPDFPAFLQALGDPDDYILYGHNLMFDACLAAWRYGFVAGFNICTLALSRQTIAKDLRRLDLDSVARHLGLQSKGSTIHKVNGMTRAMIIAAGLWQEYQEYCLGDIEIAHGVLMQLLPRVPFEELVAADVALRMAVQPSLHLDRQMLWDYYVEVCQKKEQLIAHATASVGMTKADLMSNDKFALLLESLGVDPPKKVSPTTGLETWAFAKTDPGLKELLDHADPVVQSVVAARLGVKSTIEETRALRFHNIAGLHWPVDGDVGKFPVPLKVSGAHTHRFCLVGETIIDVLRDNRVVSTRLDEVRLSDLVWDGEYFVRHGGAVPAGRKRVIEYDGITGTPDHRVWTLEHGYLPLASAKARGTPIARGAIPDPTRIDPSVYRPCRVEEEGSFHMLAMRQAGCEPVEGFDCALACLVQGMRRQREDGGHCAFGENAGCSGGVEQSAFGSGVGDPQSITYAGQAAPHQGKRTLANQTLVGQVASFGLGESPACGRQSFSKVYQPERDALPVLRRPWCGCVVCVDAVDGRLAVDEPGSLPCGDVVRSDQHERALRAGQPALGDSFGADAQPQFVETWDIVDCGPRNRFAANGRIVHNSGDWKLNAQNLKRNVPRLGEKGKSKLRWAIMVKDGYKIIVADEKQIEARMTAVFCGQWDLVEQFARGDDPYSIMATAIFKRVITKANEAERFCGKTLVLSAQYGVGPPKFRASIKHLAMEQAGLVIDLSEAEAEEYIRVYRSQTQAITNMREYLQNVVIPMMTSLSCDFMVGPIRVLHERIELPGGLCLYYKNLHQIVNKDTGWFEWIFEYNGFWKRLYGGKLLENIIQALAQIVVKQAMARLYPLFAPYDIHMALQAHDELVVVTPDCNVDYTVYHLTNEMKRTVSWLPSLPVDVDVSDPAMRYGEAK